MEQWSCILAVIFTKKQAIHRYPAGLLREALTNSETHTETFSYHYMFLILGGDLEGPRDRISIF